MVGEFEVWERVFVAEMEQLVGALEWVHGRCKIVGLEEKEMRKVEIALEEVLVNIVHYAYPEHKGEIRLICEHYPEDKLMFIVKDRGVPFNPLLHKSSESPMLNLEDREEGGLGILFTQGLVDKIDYQRDDLFNVLFLVKQLKSRK